MIIKNYCMIRIIILKIAFFEKLKNQSQHCADIAFSLITAHLDVVGWL